jgi:hypothetical protein
MTRVEAAIQRALVDWFCKTYKDYMLTATLNENSRHNVEMGVVVGITDLLIFARKNDILHVFFHELKTKNKNSKISPSQVDWHKNIYIPKLQASNTHYAVSKGLSEAKKAIIEWTTSVRLGAG